MSRALLIPFSGPSVGPGSLEEEEIGFVINTISNLQKDRMFCALCKGPDQLAAQCALAYFIGELSPGSSIGAKFH